MLDELSVFIDSRKDNLRLIAAFQKWIIPLQELNIPFSASDFIRCASGESFFSQTATLSRSLYEVKYAGFDIDRIWHHCKQTICSRRGNPYDVESVMIRLSVSRDRAEEIVKCRLDACRQDLPAFIARYGEEVGREKYNSFLEKSKTSEDNYKKRYGDAWKEKWDYFKSTRSTRSLDSFIEKFGEDQGRTAFDACNADYLKKMSLEHLISTLGEEAGRAEFARRNAKKDSSSRNSISNRLAKKLGRQPSDDEVEAAYLENRKRKSSIYQILIKKYSGEEAEERYLAYKRSRTLPDGVLDELVGRMSMSMPKFFNPCSKQSREFFSELEKSLGRSMAYGSKSKETKLYDEEHHKLYYYDCFDEESNTILEFNGSAFHPHPDMQEDEKKEWFTISGHDADSKQKLDQEKIAFATRSGYNVQVIWDREVKLKHDRESKIRQIVTVLNENKKSIKQR